MTRLLFTLASLFLLNGLVVSSASADRVVLLPLTGDAAQERLDDIEEVLVHVLSQSEHTPVGDMGAQQPDELPNDANEMRAIAEMQGAQYLIVARVTVLHDSYRLFLRVAYALETRVEELEALVYNVNQEERVREIFTAMLRPDGIGEDALRLSEDPPVPAGGTTEEPNADPEDPEDNPPAEELTPHAPPEEATTPYGQSHQWMLSAGFDLRPIIANDSARSGGVLWGGSIHLGRTFEGLQGLELRASVDIFGGAANGFSISGGAGYLLTPFDSLPLHIGAALELGLFQQLSGNRVPGFLARLSPVVVFSITDQLQLEADLPELQYISSGSGALTLGFGIRAGYRF